MEIAAQINEPHNDIISHRTDWRTALNEAIRDPAELCRMLGLDPALGVSARAASDERPLFVPQPYLARIRRGDPADPLLLQVLPQSAETASSPGFSSDPLGERSARLGPGLLQKYKGRLLMVASEACAVHCRFCFRRHFPFDGCGDAGIEKETAPESTPHCNGVSFEGYLNSVRQTVAEDSSIHEIILSGGDPLMLADGQLAELAERLAEIAHLRRLRIHTRLPVMIPSRVTDGLISSIRGTRLTTIVAVHVNHPAEIDGEVVRAFGRLADAGIPLLAQTVLLRGVNDRADVLAELFECLADLRVMPYYLHQLDRVAGAAHFEVPEETGRELLAELRSRLPGYAVPRYVRETPGGPNKEILT